MILLLSQTFVTAAPSFLLLLSRLLLLLYLRLRSLRLNTHIILIITCRLPDSILLYSAVRLRAVIGIGISSHPRLRPYSLIVHGVPFWRNNDIIPAVSGIVSSAVSIIAAIIIKIDNIGRIPITIGRLVITCPVTIRKTLVILIVIPITDTVLISVIVACS